MRMVPNVYDEVQAAYAIKCDKLVYGFKFNYRCNIYSIVCISNYKIGKCAPLSKNHHHAQLFIK